MINRIAGLVLLALLLALGACGGQSGSSGPPDTAGGEPSQEPQGDNETGQEQEPPQAPDPENIPAAAKALTQPMAVCPERIWPAVETDFIESQVIMVETVEGVDRAVLWRVEGGEVVIEALDATTLSGEWFSSFAFSEYKGRTTLGFYLNDWRGTSGEISDSWWDTSVGALFHEGFHLFGQYGWAYTPGGRAQTYPVQWEPRYLRAQLMSALYDVLVNDGDLAAAAYWYEQYLAGYTEEASGIAYTDRIEGATEYAQYIMTALAELGCDATEEQLLADIKAHLPEPGFRLRHSGESYSLGLYAGLLLRQAAAAGWQQRVEEGETLQGILLDEVFSAEQADDESLQSQVEQAAQWRNDSLAGPIEAGLSALTDEDHYRLVLDSVNAVGSTDGRGSYRLIEQTEFTTVDPHKTGTINHGSNVVFTDVHMFVPETTPCYPAPHAPHVVPVAKQDVVITSDAKATMDAGGLSFTDLEVEVIEADGYQWLCPLN